MPCTRRKSSGGKKSILIYTCDCVYAFYLPVFLGVDVPRLLSAIAVLGMSQWTSGQTNKHCKVRAWFQVSAELIV